MNVYTNTSAQELAKDISTKMSDKTGVAPQLLFADVMFILSDHHEDGKISFPQVNEVKNGRQG